MTDIRTGRQPSTPLAPMLWHLIVIGATPAGLSLANDAQRAGAERVLVLEEGSRAFPETAVGRYRIDVRFGAPLERCEARDDGRVIVETDRESFLAVAAVDARPQPASAPIPIPVPDELRQRVHLRIPEDDLRSTDVLVVGDGELAVLSALRLEAAGARVVISFSGALERLSRLAREEVAAMERERRATVLWRSVPKALEEMGALPMAFFDDRRTPDLQFDHVVYAIDSRSDGEGEGPVYRLGGDLEPTTGWETLVRYHGDDLPPLLPMAQPDARMEAREIEELREEFYNATITHFDHSHNELWVIRIRPDQKDVSYVAGQYATLGLGYWEPRVDDADEGLDDERRRKLIRRSYSISSRIFDQHGYLVDPAQEDEIELYIVHVQPDGDRIPALTPRLADKRVGDRVYLGPKVAGRYTLAPVTDPGCDVVFLATGTGEAPHNAMITELLRKGHSGKILSAVSVRYLRDLAYEPAHRRLEERFDNYEYLPLPTREPGIDKRYIQDLVVSGALGERLPRRLDPAHTHVFLCGNPAMIGLPEWTEEGPVFPDPPGVTGLLVERGFTLDHRREIGNVHYEEYW